MVLVRGRSACGLLVAVLVGVGAGAPAFGAGPERDQAQERAYAAELAPVDSKLPEQFLKASRLQQEGQHAEAEAAYRKINEAAPEHAPTLWRLSAIDRLAGRRDDAIAKARASVAAGNRWQARSTLADALMFGGGSPHDFDEAERLLRDLRDERPGEDTSLQLAMFALQRRNIEGLRAAVADLEKQGSMSPLLSYCQFVLAIHDERWTAADQYLTQAVERGFGAQAAAELRADSGLDSHLRAIRGTKAGAVVLAAWLAGLLLIFILGLAMSRQTLAAVERFDGRDRDAFVRTTRRFRSAYGALIKVGAIYYYISVPVVIVAVLALAGAIVYGFMMLGRIPIKLVLIVGIVALVSVWSMLRSLFMRRGPDEDPGRPLTEGEAPALWALLREVAARVGTRPVDAVYMTLGTEVAVIERGSVRKRLRDAGKRSLILGVGALEGMTRQQLRAILAHEYGHFSNRDTAGGDLPNVVQSSLFASMVRIAQGGGATFYNPAWHFVRGFHALFMRITLGASRLREIMADQFAAAAFGGQAFADGLRHIVRRSLEFDHHVDLLANRAQAEARPIASLYAAPAGGQASVQSDVEAKYQERMNDPGSPYDSHPPPGARISWVGRLTVETGAPPADAGEPVWTLFGNREALEREMTALANARLAAAGAFLNAPRPTPPAPMPAPG